MSKQARLKQRHFNDLGRNLQAACRQWPHLPAVSDSILCPLCRREFDRTALNEVAGCLPLLTLEHAISTAVGGTDATATLVCRRCNNEDGSSLDAQLAIRLETESFLEGCRDRPWKSILHVDGHKAAIDWTLKVGERIENDLRIVPQATRPGNAEKIKEALLNGTTDKLKVAFNYRYNQRVSQVAMLRMAFLLSFRKFGYAFALNQSVTRVIRQIQSPHENIIPGPFCLEFLSPPIDDNAILVVKEPQAFRSLLVVLRMKVQKRTFYKGVILPGPFDMDASIYERHHANQEQEFFKLNDVSYANLDDYVIDLDNSDHLLALFMIWNDICGES